MALPTTLRRTTVTMSNPAIEDILAPKPEARPRIYAYSIDDKAHEGLLKVGQTTRVVKQRPLPERLRRQTSVSVQPGVSGGPGAFYLGLSGRF